MNQVIVFKGRTTILPVSMGYDVSGDTITSEIRVDKDPESTLIATWEVNFASDGVDGELIFSLDDAESSEIEQTIGYMDIKRITGGEPVAVFEEPLEVLFKNVVTS